MSATVIRAAEAPRFGQDGTEITGYASPTRGAQPLASWRVRLQPGASSPEHTVTHGEAFIVLDGMATFTVAGVAHVVAADDAICIPPDVRFRLENTGDRPFTAICTMVAAGRARIGDGEPFVPPWAA